MTKLEFKQMWATELQLVLDAQWNSESNRENSVTGKTIYTEWE